ncbi:MAG: ribonuclease D [Devosiaceae bacterium]|nr:ribonuclease D [Devosiaceae bacterium]
MQLITETNELAQFCTNAKSYDFITIDTEFHRETTYWPILCLVQLATTDEAILVDPMAKTIDLSPLFDLMANQKITKVFHAARQDIEIFVKLANVVPTPIFDTQVAASVCGYGDQVSYDKLVQAIVGAQIDKSSRFTDWAARPLSDKQKDYALADVTYLRDVYHALSAKLVELNRLSWMQDEQKILNNINTYIVDPQDAWKRLKSKVNRPRDLAALKALGAWRENEAKKTDRPRRRILKDDAVNELAIQRPKNSQAFDRLRAVPKGFGNSRMGGDIIKVLDEVAKIPDSELPKLPPRKSGPSPKGPVGDLLRVLVKAVAEREGVAARIIANSDDIDQIVLSDTADVPAMSGWRFKLFGQKALDIKHSKLALAATKEGIVEIQLKESDFDKKND